jgi:GTP-binding protein YchF
MQIGIVGIPFSGKTTLFNTLLTHKLKNDFSKYKVEAERGIITVPDRRVDQLAEIYQPKKKVYATIEYIKVPGFEKEGHSGSGLPAQFLANIKTVDVILLLIRDFNSEMYPHPFGSVDPLRDIQYLESEFLLHDLAIIENRLSKLEKLVMKTQDERDKKELAVLTKCKTILDEERLLNELQLSEPEELLIRSYQFLTAKSFLYVLNISEEKIQESEKTVKNIQSHLRPKCAIIALSAEIEYEISQLDSEDAQVFLKEMKITEGATTKLIHASYDLLGLLSFFTVGDVECHAWNIKKGTNVLHAAGIVHSDMERGFIRAEVVPCEALIEHGSMQACKEKGLVRLEGKEYIIQDGDVVTVRFNV